MANSQRGPKLRACNKTLPTSESLLLALLDWFPTVFKAAFLDMGSLGHEWCLTAERWDAIFRTTWGVGVNRSVSLSVLGSVLLCVALVLVLPQVDLPDTAFHCGTAPISAKSRVTPRAPLVLRVTIPVWSAVAKWSSEVDCEQSRVQAVPLAKFLPTLLCSLLC